MLGSLLSPVSYLSPMEASAFFHDKLFGYPSSPPSLSNNGFSTYQNNSTGVTMKYPSDWQKTETKQGSIIIKPPKGDAAFVVQTHSLDLPSWVTEYDVLKVWLKQRVEQYSNNKSDFKLLESNLTVLDGDIASILVYREKTDPKIEINSTELFSIRTNSSNYNPYVTYHMGYDITFFTNVNAYSHYMPIFQKIIDSIDLKGKSD